MDVCPGLRVFRGPDWIHKNQDGGPGHLGSILCWGPNIPPCQPPESTMVQWDNGNKGIYRIGLDHAFDLRAYDSAPTGELHIKIWCDGCDADAIAGIRWRCTECYDIDLCTPCYMSDKHNVNHRFMRVHSSMESSLGPVMPPRAKARHMPIRGIFPGARVVEHPAWLCGKIKNGPGIVVQDAAKEKEGQILVEFASGQYGRMNLGYRMELDVTCSLAGTGGEIYPGHLPCLGDEERIRCTDSVIIAVTDEEFEKLQKRRGLWDPKKGVSMPKVTHNSIKVTREGPPGASLGIECKHKIPMEATVFDRTDDGNFVLEFWDYHDNIDERWTVNPSTLKKVHNFCPGQIVRVTEDFELFQRLQISPEGERTATRKQKMAGKIGRVMKIENGEVHVKFDKHQSKNYTFHPATLLPDKKRFLSDDPDPYMDSESQSFKGDAEKNILSAATIGNIAMVKMYLDKEPNLINYQPTPGRILLSYVASHGNAEMLQLLINRGAFVESFDLDECTPLMHAISENKPENVECLLENGADVDAVDEKGVTCLILAIRNGYADCVSLLLEYDADVTIRERERLTAVTAAASYANTAVFDMILALKHTDLKAVSASQMCAVHFATMSNLPYQVKKIAKRLPRLINQGESDGFTPLMNGVHRNAIDAIRVLLKLDGIDVNKQEMGIQGHTAISIAIHAWALEILHLLLENGADLNIPDKDGNTCLVFALGHLEALCMSKEEPRFINDMRWKFRSLGLRMREEAVLAYLVWNGADLNYAGRDGETILDKLLSTGVPLGHMLKEVQDRRMATLPNKDAKRQPITAGTKSRPKPDKRETPKPSNSSRAQPKQKEHTPSGRKTGCYQSDQQPTSRNWFHCPNKTPKAATSARGDAARMHKATASGHSAPTKTHSAADSKPYVATSKPGGTNGKQSATTGKPSATATKPSATASKPSATSSKPNATSSKPSTTASKSSPAAFIPGADVRPRSTLNATPTSKGDAKQDSAERLEQLKMELEKKDKELARLRQKARRLEHLVKKKIEFSCGHGIIMTISELIPECNVCCEPITGVCDL